MLLYCVNIDSDLLTVSGTNRSVKAERENPATSTSPIEEIHSWKQSGASFEDIVERLRMRCVPTGYTPKPWMQGIYYFVCD